MIPSAGGCFELTVGGTKLYSKLKTGEFPDENDWLKPWQGDRGLSGALIETVRARGGLRPHCCRGRGGIRAGFRRRMRNGRSLIYLVPTSWFVPPIDVLLISHRLVDQGVQARVVGFQRLAGVDGPFGADRRGAGAGGVEIGLDAGGPVFVAVARRRGPRQRPLPFASSCSF